MIGTSAVADASARPTSSSGSSSATPPRHAALDGLRGIAILMVLVMHCYVIVPTPEGVAMHDGLKRACSLFFSGVDLFFVLSGFLIGGILLDHRDAPNLLSGFFARRFFRIAPLYALLLVTYFFARELPGLGAMSGGAYFDSPVPLWSYFTMLQNISMSSAGHVGNYWLSPTWSLGIEEQFYLLMPFAVRQLTRRTLIYACLLAFVACPMLRLSALLFAGNSVAATFLLPMRADSLLAGVLCAATLRDPAVCAFLRRHRPLFGASLVGLVLFLGVLSSRGLSAGSPLMVSVGYSLVTTFCAGVVLWPLLFPAGAFATALGAAPLRAVGGISYFIYLFHTPILFGVHWALRQQPPLHHDLAGIAITLLALGATFLLGALSWKCLETPLLRIGRRFTYA